MFCRRRRIIDPDRNTTRLFRQRSGLRAQDQLFPRGHRYQPPPLALAFGLSVRRTGGHREQRQARRTVLLHAPTDSSQVNIVNFATIVVENIGFILSP